ncbi:MAG: hypothetical protein JNM18_18430 [Planctomycetaceae bacterium]|nr:hypothetical protein [Planctomycetaceae bacterium]
MPTQSPARRLGLVWLVIPVLSAAWFHLGAEVWSRARAQDAAQTPNKIVEATPLTKEEERAFSGIGTREQNPGQLIPADAPLIEKKIKAVIAEFTMPTTTDAGPSGATKLRNDWRLKITNASRLQFKDFHKAVNAGVIAHATPVILDKEVNPLARVNLLMLVGSLDRVEREGATPAIPLPEGTTKLVEVLKSTDVPAYLQATAIESLTRHAELETTPQQRKEIVAAITPYLAGKRPEKYDPAGWHWLCKRSANILQAFAEKSLPEANDPAVVAGLVTILTDESLPYTLRIDAAATIAAIDSKNLSGTNKLKEAVVGVGETAKAMATESGNPEKSLPLITHVLYMVNTLADALRRGDGQSPTGGAKGLLAGADANLKSPALNLHSKLTTCSDQLTKTLPKNLADVQKAKITPAVHQPILDQLVTEVEAVIKPLRGNTVAQAPAASK